MAGVSRSVATDLDGPTIHNEGPSSITVRVVVHGDGVFVESVTLEAGTSHTVSTAAGSCIEVHTPDRTATAPADRGSFFIVGAGRVIVVPRRGEPHRTE